MPPSPPPFREFSAAAQNRLRPGEFRSLTHLGWGLFSRGVKRRFCEGRNGTRVSFNVTRGRRGEEGRRAKRLRGATDLWSEAESGTSKRKVLRALCGLSTKKGQLPAHPPLLFAEWELSSHLEALQKAAVPPAFEPGARCPAPSRERARVNPVGDSLAARKNVVGCSLQRWTSVSFSLASF